MLESGRKEQPNKGGIEEFGEQGRTNQGKDIWKLKWHRKEMME